MSQGRAGKFWRGKMTNSPKDRIIADFTKYMSNFQIHFYILNVVFLFMCGVPFYVGWNLNSFLISVSYRPYNENKIVHDFLDRNRNFGLCFVIQRYGMVWFEGVILALYKIDFFTVKNRLYHNKNRLHKKKSKPNNSFHFFQFSNFIIFQFFKSHGNMWLKNHFPTQIFYFFFHHGRSRKKRLSHGKNRLSHGKNQPP